MATTMRAAIREAAGLDRNNRYPIVIVDGFSGPMLTGCGYYHVNQYGCRVDYPFAYLRKAKSARLTYVSSTIRLEVGAGWIIQNGLDELP